MSAAINRPMIRKELRQLLRGTVALVLQNLYLLGMAGIAAVAGLIGTWGAPAWYAGAGGFWAILYAQVLIVVLIGTALVASSVTLEREQNTFDILLSTPLVSRQIVLGKLAANLAAGGSIVVLSVPIAACCFLLGGVSLSPAVWAHVLLFGALVVAAAMGICWSTSVQRTAAAVPLAVLSGLGLLLLPGIAISSSMRSLAALSPVSAVSMVQQGILPPFFTSALPVWLISLVLWALLCLVLIETAVQSLRHPHRRRSWRARWLAALLIAAVALLVMGGMGFEDATRGACVLGSCCAQEDTPKFIAGRLGGYAGVATFALLLLVLPGYAAGLPTPSERLPRAGPEPGRRGLGERLFGRSLIGGHRYVLLLLLLVFALGLLGLRLWGAGIFTRWWAPLALAFVPAAAAVWACGVLCRITMLLQRPRSDTGRKGIALLLVGALLIGAAIPAFLLSVDSDEPGFAAELASTMMLATGLLGPFSVSATPWASERMQVLTQVLPGWLLTALWHLLAGAVFVFMERSLRRRAARRRPVRPSVPPAPPGSLPPPSPPAHRAHPSPSTVQAPPSPPAPPAPPAP